MARLRTRGQLEAVHRVIPFPLAVLSQPYGMMNGAVSGRQQSERRDGHTSNLDSFKHLKNGGAMAVLAPREANADLLRQVNRTDEFIKLQEQYLRN